MPISPPQRGIGFDSKIFSDRSRKSRIHAGSCFISEIAETIVAFSPRCGLEHGVRRRHEIVLVDFADAAFRQEPSIKSVAMIVFLILVPMRS